MTHHDSPARDHSIRRITWTAAGTKAGTSYTVSGDPATGLPSGCSCPAYNLGRNRGQNCKHMDRAERGELGKPRLTVVQRHSPATVTIQTGDRTLVRPSCERPRLPAVSTATAADLYGE